MPEDKALIFNVGSGMANQYIRDLSKNVKRGMQTKLNNGDYPNNAKFGYVNDKINKKYSLTKSEENILNVPMSYTPLAVIA